MKKFISKILILSFMLLMFGTVGVEEQSYAANKKIDFNFANQDGRVTKITSSYVKFRSCLGSAPETWSKIKTLKLTSKTKYYFCVKTCDNYTKYLIKSVSKKTALSKVKKNKDNYVFFKKKGNTVTMFVYGMENFVG